MTISKIEVQASCAFSHAAQAVERKTPTDLVIHVESDCIGLSQQLATDLETAMEIGAGPLAHEVMIDRMARADREHRPLACSLTYPS